MSVKDEENTIFLEERSTSSVSSSVKSGLERDRSSSNAKGYVVLASTLALVLLLFAWSNSTAGHLDSPTASFLQKRGLLEKTINGDVMPVPFWSIRQDVDRHKMRVQNAFAALYYMKDKETSMTDDDGNTYTASFFDKVTMTDKDGKESILGYFNPTLPEGLKTTTVMLNYGDKCAATNQYREGQVDLECGYLGITKVVEITPCRYVVTVTTPEVCSAKDFYDYLKSSTATATDGGWWNYKVNFFRHKTGDSQVVMFHSDGAHSARIMLGDIAPTLNEDADMTFQGDICESTKVPRSGTIKVECGCMFAVKSLTETQVCEYEMIISHPKACRTEPACNVSALKAELLQKKRAERMMIEPGDWDEIYSTRMTKDKFPRDLLNVKYSGQDMS